MKFPINYSEMKQMFYYTKPICNYYIHNNKHIMYKLNDKKKIDDKEKDMINFNQYAQYSKRIYK